MRVIILYMRSYRALTEDWFVLVCTQNMWIQQYFFSHTHTHINMYVIHSTLAYTTTYNEHATEWDKISGLGHHLQGGDYKTLII